jgi:hypothetical protein
MTTVHETEAQHLLAAPLPAPAAGPAHRGWALLLVLFVAAELAWLGLLGFAFVSLVT